MKGKGYGWGATSVLLVTLAQLLMKWGMVQLPPLSLSLLNIDIIMQHYGAYAAVAGGIIGYAASMLCWFLALRDLPLNRAYPLLSLSYVLVLLAAVTLPWFHESINWLKILGALSILFGVWLIHSQPAAVDTQKIHPQK